MRTTTTVLLAAFCLSVSAQHIARYEYWTDSDEAHRKQAIAPADGDISMLVDVTGLKEGMHSFHFRAQDSNGQWSSPLMTYFMRLPAVSDNADVLTYEYWIDSNASIKGTVSGDIVSLAINTKILKEGMHSFHFRAQDSNGKWSMPLMTYFLRLPAIGDPAKVLSYEYWIDDDESDRVKGNTTDSIVSFNLNATNLTQGLHSFHFRAKDSEGRWSTPLTSYFLRIPLATDGSTTISYEYWVDDNYEQRTKGITTDGLIQLQMDASSLRAGLHWLSLRTQDAEGRWSAPVSHYFTKPHTRVDNLVAAYYYWYNGHVEDAQLVRLSEPASPLLLDVDLPTNNLTQEVTRENITMLTTPDGQQQLAMKNVLSMQFMDDRGQWSTTQVDTFAVSVGQRVVSLTPFLVNPEADEQWKGWTTQGNRSIATDGHWSGEADNYFHLNAGAEMRQTISGLPAGTYVLAANGRSATDGQLTLSACGYTTTFPATPPATDDIGQGWSQRSLSFVTDGEPFDIVATATGGWADIDGYQLTVNGLMDRAGTIGLNDVAISDIADKSLWNEVGSPVRLTVGGLYTSKKSRMATIYCVVDNGTPIRLADDIASGSRFDSEVECFFRQNANPHTLTFYARDSEGVTSEQVVLQVGNVSRACTVEGLPQVAIYTGSPIVSDSVRIIDSRTGELLTEGEDYTLYYKNNVDDGQATLVVEGVYPRYLGRKEVVFTIKSEITPTELAALRQLYIETHGDSLWHRKWSAIEQEQVLSDELTGVSVRNRHVTAIHLRANGLTGTIPASVLALPQLQVLNLENNNLRGIVPTNSIQANLHELLLAGNGLSRLEGAVPATVEKLTLGNQTIDEVGTFHLIADAIDSQMEALPNMGLYDHSQRSFSRDANVRIMTQSYDNPTLAMMSRRDGEWLLRTDEWGRRTYSQAQGDTIFCRDDAGNCFRIALTYETGDANIDATVNVQDLAALLMYCLNNWQATFNVGAANLWDDEIINVQDAICLVNLLLNSAPPSVTESPQAASRQMTQSEASAMLTCADGQLMLQTPVPVAAFDIVLKGTQLADVTQLMEPLGFIMSMKQQGNSTHLVGYSPSGALLPVGNTVLAMVSNHRAVVEAALLADEQAHAVAVVANSANSINDVHSGLLGVTVGSGVLVVTAGQPLDNIEWTLLSASGAILDSGHVSSLPAGISRISCHTPERGVCLLRLKANGHQPIVKKVHTR